MPRRSSSSPPSCWGSFRISSVISQPKRKWEESAIKNTELRKISNVQANSASSQLSRAKLKSNRGYPKRKNQRFGIRLQSRINSKIHSMMGYPILVPQVQKSPRAFQFHPHPKTANKFPSDIFQYLIYPSISSSSSFPLDFDAGLFYWFY
jgi:hypothetical protein